MVSHPDTYPVQQGLTSVNKREPVFPFGDSRTTCLNGALNKNYLLYYLPKWSFEQGWFRGLDDYHVLHLPLFGLFLYP